MYYSCSVFVYSIIYYFVISIIIILLFLLLAALTGNKSHTFISSNLAEICSTAKFRIPIKEDLHIGHMPFSWSLHGLHTWCPFMHWIFIPCDASKHTGHWSNSSSVSHHWSNQECLFSIMLIINYLINYSNYYAANVSKII